MSTLLALALTFSAAPLPMSAAPVFGPPALCHRIEIGGARSLPWDGPHGFDTDDSYNTDALISDTLEILLETDDILVHMETLRRAGIYARQQGFDRGREGRSVARELLAALRGARAAQSSRSVAASQRAMRSFDLGYAAAVLRQGGASIAGTERESIDAALAQAVELRPNAPGLHLARSLAGWKDDSRRASLLEFDRALRLAGDSKRSEGLLHENLVAVGSWFLDATSYDQMVSELRRAIG